MIHINLNMIFYTHQNNPHKAPYGKTNNPPPPPPPHTHKPQSLAQPQPLISFRKVKTIIRWTSHPVPENQKDPVHRLERQQNTTIFRLTTGHHCFHQHVCRLGLVARTEDCRKGLLGVRTAVDPKHAVSTPLRLIFKNAP